MRRRMATVVVCAGALAATLAVAGCQPAGGLGAPGPGDTSSIGTESGGTGTGLPTSTSTTGGGMPTAEPTSQVVEYRVAYNWAVPTPEVSVTHQGVPIPPPAPPLPYLVGVYAGNHPDEAPKYQRMSFYFRGGFPSYHIGYVAAVLSEGKGEAIPLQGNAFLRVGFVGAQAHDNVGFSVKASPKNPIDFPTLRGYGYAGDYEGYVTYGLGLQVAPGSDQVLRIRVGELKRTDGAGSFFYVVFVDIENPT